MKSIILRPDGLWLPRRRVPVATPLYPVPRWFPQAPDGLLWASGDTVGAFGPQENNPPGTNYAAIVSRNGHLYLAFDSATQQTAIFAGVMPRNYGGGGLTVYLHWVAATATSGTIGWGVTFERDNAANHDLDADAWATEQIVTATSVDATSGKLTTTSVAIAAGAAGTDSIGPGDPFRIRIRRDVITDTAAGDGQLKFVEIKET